MTDDYDNDCFRGQIDPCIKYKIYSKSRIF